MRFLISIDVKRLIDWPQDIGDTITLLSETGTRDEAIEQAMQTFDCPLAKRTFELRERRIGYLEQLHLRGEPVLHQYLDQFDAIRAYDLSRHYKVDPFQISYGSLADLERKRTTIRDQFKQCVVKEELDISLERWDSAREFLNIWYKNLSQTHLDLTNKQDYRVKMNFLQSKEHPASGA